MCQKKNTLLANSRAKVTKNIEIINEWVQQANEKHFADTNIKDYTYLSFIQEIDKYINERDFSFISQVKLFRFSDGNFYSFYEIDTNPNLILIYEKIWPIKRELRTLGFIVSDLNLSFKKEGDRNHSIYIDRLQLLAAIKTYYKIFLVR